MNPVYFGSPQKLLFGVHYPPQTRGQKRASGVVLCYPMAHEYVYTHRAFRQLATRLARNGFYVLRFDYSGMGDSAGDSDESSLDRWVDDISAAIDEIKNASGLAKVSLIGLRLGATASILAAERRNDVESLVLWEPITDGSKYVEELFAVHDKWADENLPSHAQPPRENGSFEIIGTPFSQKMRTGLERINLMQLQNRVAERVLHVGNGNHPTERFNDVLKRLNHDVEYQQTSESDAWDSGGGINTVYVPGQTLNQIVSWISKVSR